MDEDSSDQLLRERLELATPSELGRMREHLTLKEVASNDDIIKAYLDAADNTILNVVRPVVKSQEPFYSQILRIIYKELRSYSEGLDDSWRAVKSIKFWNYRSPVEDWSNKELEEKIFEMYSAEYSDARKKLIANPGLWSKVTGYLTSVGGAAAGTVATVTSVTATRLPFAAVATGAVAGPISIGLAVVMFSFQASGPAFRKIVPATVELLLIERRIKFMPKE